MITRGGKIEPAQSSPGKDNAISDVARDDGAFVPIYLSMVPIF